MGEPMVMLGIYMWVCVCTYLTPPLLQKPLGHNHTGVNWRNSPDCCRSKGRVVLCCVVSPSTVHAVCWELLSGANCSLLVTTVCCQLQSVGNYWMDVATLPGNNSPVLISYQGADARTAVSPRLSLGCDWALPEKGGWAVDGGWVPTAERRSHCAASGVCGYIVVLQLPGRAALHRPFYMHNDDIVVYIYVYMYAYDVTAIWLVGPVYTPASAVLTAVLLLLYVRLLC